jgi:dephospho-CoA kinase
MLRVGLTGGIASGKSTVSALLAGLGAFVVDADAISRKATAAGGAAIDMIRTSFGSEYITALGALDRDRMRDLIFSEPTARQKLQDIVHPLVAMETAEQTSDALSLGRRCIVYDVPLLVESAQWRSRVDKVLVVDCEADVQIERSHLRNGIDRLVVKKIMASQASRELRLHAADIVLCNTHLSLQELAGEVREMSSCFGL